MRCNDDFYASPSEGMCHEMATKGTGKGGLEPQMQEYGCRKMNFGDISVAEIVIVHVYIYM